MKKILLFLILLSTVSFGQISKSVLTPAQKDTVKKIIADSLDANSRGWQTASQVRSIVGDSSNVLRGLINSGAGLDTNAVRNIAKQSALDTLKIVSIYSQEPSGSNAYAIVNVGGELRRVMLQNLPTQLQVQTQIQALWDSLGRVAAGLGGVTPTYPNPVTNLTATADNQKVTLNWTNPSQRDSIRIERASSLTGGTVFTQLAYVGANTTTYVDTPVVNNVTYTYRLRVYYQGFASSSVTVDAVPSSPLDLPYYLTIQPTSINYDTISRYTLSGGDSVFMDAESSNQESGSSVNNVSLGIIDSAKVSGNYGYQIQVTSSGGTGYYYKNITSNTNGDTVEVSINIKIPYQYVGLGSTSNMFVPLRIVNTLGDNTTNEILGDFVIRANTGSNAPTLYRYRYRSGGTGSAITSTIISGWNLNIGQTYTLKIKYMRNSDNTNCRFVFYLNSDSVGGANNINIGNDYAKPKDARFGIYEMYSGTNSINDRFFFDNLVIKGGQSGTPTPTQYKYANIFVKNDSSITLNLRSISTPNYPFVIIYGDTTKSRFLAGDTTTYSIRFDDDATYNLYNSSLTFVVDYPNGTQYHNQTISLTGQGHGAPPAGGGDIISASYYFDALSGNDNNSGTSPSQAWKTASKFNSTTFPAGSIIAFRDSMEYPGAFTITESGTSGSRITITNWYGESSGRYPLILGAGYTTVPSNVWSQTAGYTNVWEASATGYKAVWFFFPDSIRWGVRESGLGTLDREFETYYASGKLYVYSPSNPGTRYSKVAYNPNGDTGDDASCFNVYGSYITLSNLQFGFSSADGLKFMPNGFYNEAINCKAFYNGKSVVLADNDENGSGIYISSSNITVKKCTVYEVSSSGYRIWGNNTHNMTNILIDSCVAYNNHHNTGGSINSTWLPITNVTIRNSYFYTTMVEGHFAHWEDWRMTPNNIGFIFNCQSGTGYEKNKNIYFYNNIIRNTPGPGIQIQGVDSVYIFNNTIIQLDSAGDVGSTGKPWNWSIYGSTINNSTMVMRNNISLTSISEPTNYTIRAYSNTIMSNNLAYRLDGSSYLIYPFDATYVAPINANPQFVNYLGSSMGSFNLTSSSPARDAGTNLSSYFTKDIIGTTRPQGSAWDIGAYEYVP